MQAASSPHSRERLVETITSKGFLRSDAVRDAFRSVPREVFVPEVADEKGLDAVYQDEVFVTQTDVLGNATSSSSMPGVMALMLEQLDVRPGQRVLEIGTGTGYNAAVLKEIVGDRGRVVTVELDPLLVRRARTALANSGHRMRVVCGDGHLGWEPGAPYDRVLATTSSAHVPEEWRNQVRDGGVIVFPWRLSESVTYPQLSVSFRRHGEKLVSSDAQCVGFMGMRSSPEAPSVADPELRVTERIDGEERLVGMLSGEAIRRLSRRRRFGLMAMIAQSPRKRKLGFAVPWFPAMCWVALAVPRRWVVANAIGLMSPDGSGLALLRGGPKTATRIEAWGSPESEHMLVEAMSEYRARGKPGLDRLQIVVADRAEKGRWRSFRISGSVVSVMWS